MTLPYPGVPVSTPVSLLHLQLFSKTLNHKLQKNAPRLNKIIVVGYSITLTEQFDDAFDFLLSRLHHSWEIKETRREESLEIPKEALREVLLNLLVHRNYHLPPPSKIAIFDNRIEIFSPGNFPGPLNYRRF